MTDEDRLDGDGALAALDALPPGSAVIVRHRDPAALEALARALRGPCRVRRLRLLVAGDGRLAARVGADGVHLPESAAARGSRPSWRRPGWLVTAAAHSPAALRRAARAGADAALLAPVFATASHPGRPPLGPLRFRLWCRESPIPVLALGGITARTARRLLGPGAPAGFAAVGAFTARP